MTFRKTAPLMAATLLAAACGAPNSGKTDVSLPANTPEPTSALENISEPYRSADIDLGKRLFRGQCSGCHTLAEGDVAIVGPNLHGMFDRVVGSSEDYGFSNALLNASFEWTPEALDQWLAAPEEFLPGNNMPMSGLTDATDRANIVAYIIVETSSK